MPAFAESRAIGDFQNTGFFSGPGEFSVTRRDIFQLLSEAARSSARGHRVPSVHQIKFGIALEACSPNEKILDAGLDSS